MSEEENIEAVWACADARPPEQLPSELRDNVYGHCSICRRSIMWRPYAIAEAEKTCLKCVKVLSDAFTEIGETPEVVVVDKARDEFSSIYGEKLTVEAMRRVDKMFRDKE
jgi:hypothetical protein